jgi:hypothetical protein
MSGKNLRRLPRPYPRCPQCGARFPSKEFLRLHLVRDCHGLPGKRGAK